MNKQKIIQAIELLREALQEESSYQTKKEYKVTPEQEARWKKIRPTKGTLDLLIQKGYPEDELLLIKTQWAAHVILQNLKSENI